MSCDTLFLQDWWPGWALTACRITGHRTFARGCFRGSFYCWLQEAGDKLLVCGVFVHVWCVAYTCVFGIHVCASWHLRVMCVQFACVLCLYGLVSGVWCGIFVMWGMCGMCVLCMECTVCGVWCVACVMCVHSVFCTHQVCVVDEWHVTHNMYVCGVCVCCVCAVYGTCVLCLLEATHVFTGLGDLGSWALHSSQQSVALGGIRGWSEQNRFPSGAEKAVGEE